MNELRSHQKRMAAKAKTVMSFKLGFGVWMMIGDELLQYSTEVQSRLLGF